MAEKRIRLACVECFREDFDGIDEAGLDRAAAGGWTGFTEYQSYEESVRTYDDPGDAPPGYSVFDWYTHLGTCPDCQDETGDGTPG